MVGTLILGWELVRETIVYRIQTSVEVLHKHIIKKNHGLDIVISTSWIIAKFRVESLHLDAKSFKCYPE